MNSRYLISTLVMVGMIAGATTAMSSEPPIHDHQKTKTNINTTHQADNNAERNCDKPIGEIDQDSGSDAALSDVNSKNCTPQENKKKIHDHRKSKNL